MLLYKVAIISTVHAKAQLPNTRLLRSTVSLYSRKKERKIIKKKKRQERLAGLTRAADCKP